MDTIEVCVHQGVDIGHHVLFKEKWERCMKCTYDPENNKKCPDYSPGTYFTSDSIFSIPKNINGIRVA